MERCYDALSRDNWKLSMGGKKQMGMRKCTVRLDKEVNSFWHFRSH